MAKRKSNKGHFTPKLPAVDIPDSAKRQMLSIAFFAAALIFVFSFFQNAGIAGSFFFGAGTFLFGGGVFLLPLAFLLAAFVLWGQDRWDPRPVFFALTLLILGISGLTTGFAVTRGLDAREIGGILGAFLSWPALQAFGFWVSEVIFAAVGLAGLVIFWQLVPHGKEKGKEEESLSQVAQEKIKKIFEPKFEVQEVEPVVSSDTAVSPEEKVETKKKEKLQKARELAPFLGSSELPPTDLLDGQKSVPSAGDIKMNAALVRKTLQNFDIDVEVSEINIGPTVTQYAFKPAEGVRLSRITALSNDLSLALAAHPLRIEAPIPGRALVGIEIPNTTRATVRMRDLLEHHEFKDNPSPLLLALGRDVSGNSVFADLARMPHLLIAGATGSGKTIGLNNVILSLVYRNSPHALRFVLVDPKRVEFPVYNDLPHLLCPVIMDTQRTLSALKWLIKEMERRFDVLSRARVRDLASYHEKSALEAENKKEGEEPMEELPYIVVVIDELADLMAARGKELEVMIVRLAQMSRAVGIHLVLATQRPSVEVITGIIKANIPGRVAFQVASQIDSRTILDMAGAEKLLGRGDMLALTGEFAKPKRIQGAFLSDKEVKKVVSWIANETSGFENQGIPEDQLAQSVAQGLEGTEYEEGEEDPMYEEAKKVVLETRKASASFLQRRLRLGYARAARLIDLMEERGVVGPGEGSKPREVFGEGSPKEEEEKADWYSPQT
ncbi:MAG: DNA translocase FtsK [Candidatus Yanofskybacteria bacterium]|nr:DNA translocase FtsK [Candidatus Yanofskybacteria bacterium]